MEPLVIGYDPERGNPRFFNSAIIATAVSEPEANERGSSLIGGGTHFSLKRKGLWSKAKGIVVMRV